MCRDDRYDVDDALISPRALRRRRRLGGSMIVRASRDDRLRFSLYCSFAHKETLVSVIRDE